MKEKFGRELFPYVYDKLHILSAKPDPTDSLSFSITVATGAHGNSNNSNNNNNTNSNNNTNNKITYTIAITKVKHKSEIPMTIDTVKEKSELSFIESCLNIIHRERFNKLNYSRPFTKDSYFSIKDDSFVRINQREQYPKQCLRYYPALRFLKGYKSSVHYCKSNIFIKTDVRFKAVCLMTLHELIEQNGVLNIQQLC